MTVAGDGAEFGKPEMLHCKRSFNRFDTRRAPDWSFSLTKVMHRNGFLALTRCENRTK
jgi:hypothetical protein